jgi:hypothetical protein
LSNASSVVSPNTWVACNTVAAVPNNFPARPSAGAYASGAPVLTTTGSTTAATHAATTATTATHAATTATTATHAATTATTATHAATTATTATHAATSSTSTTGPSSTTGGSTTGIFVLLSYIRSFLLIFISGPSGTNLVAAAGAQHDCWVGDFTCVTDLVTSSGLDGTYTLTFTSIPLLFFLPFFIFILFCFYFFDRERLGYKRTG